MHTPPPSSSRSTFNDAPRPLIYPGIDLGDFAPAAPSSSLYPSVDIADFVSAVALSKATQPPRAESLIYRGVDLSDFTSAAEQQAPSAVKPIHQGGNSSVYPGVDLGDFIDIQNSSTPSPERSGPPVYPGVDLEDFISAGINGGAQSRREGTALTHTSYPDVDMNDFAVSSGKSPLHTELSSSW
jgi:hypothetical protein